MCSRSNFFYLLVLSANRAKKGQIEKSQKNLCDTWRRHLFKEVAVHLLYRFFTRCHPIMVSWYIVKWLNRGGVWEMVSCALSNSGAVIYCVFRKHTQEITLCQICRERSLAILRGAILARNFAIRWKVLSNSLYVALDKASS